MTEPQNDAGKLSPLKQAYLVLERTQEQLSSLERSLREPIAIVGLGCRLPGSANTPEAFWRLLALGQDAITDVPANRWDGLAFLDPDPDTPGKMVSQCGGFVDEVESFDAHFFRISPREVKTLDPQQRLLLEVSFEALEDAGMAPDRLAGTCGGVFVGICGIDYSKRITRRDPALIDAYIGTGNSHSVAAGRLSYFFGLQGPSVAIDTACSSSLVALHWACQCLRARECDFALAGGVNLLLDPELSINFSKAHMLSPSGRCKAFDASADGYVRGEGAAMVVLKRLSDAQAANDRIWALVRGSAINQDGPSSGLTVPNGPSQREVIRRALAAANLQPQDIDYLEAHGTGTSLGDPIEMIALGDVFRGRSEPLRVGSVKTNIGHLEATAGVAGVLKVVLALQQEQIPPHLHFRQPSPRIPWNELPLRVPTQLEPWPRGPRPRRAGVSAFAFNGTNAHVTLEEAPRPEMDSRPECPCQLLTLSAETPESLRDRARDHESRLGTEPPQWSDLCYTASAGRAHFPHRLALRAETAAEARQRLQKFLDGGKDSECECGEVESESPAVAFLFSGQGAQYAGMGRQLRESEPTFRAAMEECEQILRDHLDRPLREILEPDAASIAAIDETIYAQPALFALEYSLARMWQHWGIHPTAMIGHSVGEYVAACLAGVFCLEDGLKLIAARGRMMQELPRNGRMAAVLAGEDQVREALAGLADQVDIAAVNGPRQIVISGLDSAVEEAVSRLARAGIAAKTLRVSHAFHSRLMEPMLADFRRIGESVAFHRPQFKLISNLTGRVVQDEVVRPDYWVQHVRQTVRFADGVAALAGDEIHLALEIGPQSTLVNLARACWPSGAGSRGPRWLSSLHPGKPDWHCVLDALAAIYVAGQEVDWAAFHRGFRGRIVSLPHYPFQRERHWIEPGALGGAGGPAVSARVVHPLLGRRLDSAAVRDTVHFEGRMSSTDPSYLQDHRIFEMVVFPGTGFLEMAASAGRQLHRAGPVVVEDVAFERVIAFPEDRPNVVQVVLMPEGTGHRCELFSRPEASSEDASVQWTCHARGRVSAGAEERALLDLESMRGICVQELPVGELYDRLGREDLNYGPCFRGLKQMFRQGREVLGKIELPEGHRREAEQYQLHPALLDTCLHVMAGIVTDEEVAQGDVPPFLPVSLRRLRLLAPAGPEVWSYAKVHGEGHFRDAVAFTADLHLFRPDGQPVAVLEELRMQRVPRSTLLSLIEPPASDWLYELSWRPVSGPSGRASGDAKTWILLADQGGVAEEVARHLAASAERCVLVRPGERFAFAAARTEEVPQAVVRADSPEDYTRLLQETLAHAGAASASSPPSCEVVHFWSLGLPEDASDGFRRSHQSGCGSVLGLVQALAAWSGPVAVTLVTRGAQAVGHTASEGPSLAQAPLWGLGRVIAVEHPALRCRRLDLDPAADRRMDVAALLAELRGADAEDQVAYRQSNRHVARLVRIKKAGQPSLTVPDVPYRLQLTAMGTLDSVKPVPCARRRPNRGEVEIAVAEAGLNFRDVLRSLGMIEAFEKTIGARLGYSSALDAPLGFECAGRVAEVGEGVEHVREGDEVLAIAYGSLASHVVAAGGCVVRKPESLSMSEAATIPMAFVTASYGLEDLAGLRAGERVLIHAAAGGVGQAAVQVAQAIGAEVLATASPGKWDQLQAQGIRHVMNSRSLEFRDEVLRATGGEGVDVVLNSLGGDFIPASLSTLRRGGRFVEIGLLGMWDPQQVSREFPEVSYFTLDIDREETQRPGSTRAVLERLRDRLEAGTLRPLPFREFPIQRIVDALRHFNQARRVGKVVVAVSSEEVARCNGKSEIRRDATYLISGGLGALGLLVARWLVERGARYLVLASRSGLTDQAQAATVRQLQEAGATVEVVSADVSRREDVQRLLETTRASLPPLRGVFHAAGVLDDGILRLQDWERFERVMRPKVAGAWHLHELTNDLELFVLFSSGVGLVGAHGQGNYAAGNAFLDALAHYRRLLGLPAVSIAWGPWADLGMTARMDDRARARMAQIGLKAISADDGMKMLGQLMEGTRAHVAPMRIDWQRLAATVPPQPLWSELASPPVAAEQGPSVVLEQLRAAPPGDRLDLLVAHLRSEVAAVLGWGADSRVGRRQKLFELGMDSLTSVELRHRLQRNLACSLPLTVVFDYPTVDALAQFIVGQMSLPEEKPAPSEPVPTSLDAGADRLAAMSDEEVESLLAVKFKDLLDE